MQNIMKHHDKYEGRRRFKVSPDPISAKVQDSNVKEFSWVLSVIVERTFLCLYEFHLAFCLGNVVGGNKRISF